MAKLKVEYIALDALKAYERNTRTHSKEQVEQLKASIAEFGFTNPVLIDEDNVLIAGHGRTEAARALGMTEVPAIRIKGLTEAQRNALRIADNSLALNAGWDTEALREELESLKDADFDVGLLGLDALDIDGIDLDELPPPVELVEDEPPAPDEVEVRCKPGEVWQLGDHRLMCGDSTKAEDVSRLMAGEKADLVFTDPPYGMKKEAEGVLNDNLNFDDLLEFNKRWIPLSFANLKDNGSWYCWGIDEPLMDIYANILKPMAKRNEITFRNLLTWDKGHGQGQMASSWRSYATADEKCLFVMCGVQGFNTNADNYFDGWEPIRAYLSGEKQKMGWNDADIKRILGVTTGRHYFSKSQWEMPTEKHYKALQAAAAGEVFKREYEDIKREYEDIKREYYATRAYFDNTHDNQNNVWHFSRTSNEERELTGGHATPKPIALCARAITSSSRIDETVLDLFGGSGTTLIASEQTNRKARLMELDPHYCDVILARWEKLTGRTAERLT
jgi:DNA modification methylase